MERLNEKSRKEGEGGKVVTERGDGKEFKDGNLWGGVVTKRQLEALKKTRAALKEKRIKRKSKSKKRIFRRSIFDEIFG